MEGGQISKLACEHRDDIEFHCESCSQYTCVDCYNKLHKDHNKEPLLLSTMVKQAIGEYSVLIGMCEKQLSQVIVQPQEDHLEYELLRIEKDIWQNYANVIQYCGENEELSVEGIECSRILSKMEDEKEEFEHDVLPDMKKLNNELDNSIRKAISALTWEKYEQVEEYLQSEYLERFEKKFDDCMVKKGSLDRFINSLAFAKSIEPDIACSASDVSAVVSVRGPFNIQLKLLTYDLESRSVLAYMPETLLLKKYPIPGIALPRGFAQTAFDFNKLLLCGGNGSAAGFVFSELNEQMAPIASMSLQRADHGICNKGDREIIVVGGYEEQPLSSVEAYQVASNQWKLLPCTNEAKENPVVVLFACRYLYALSSIEEVETLDLSEGKGWEVKKLVVGVISWTRFGCVQISPYEMLIFGGETKGRKSKRSVSYDIEKRVAKHIEDLPSEAYFRSEDLAKDKTRVYALSSDRSRVYNFDFKSEHWSMVYTEDFTIKYSCANRF
eukprot:TRINITY_DN747_c0_g4_i1.p1 TRINITY_DN747_c0_g4~~TRINITY_DN747_c0_g4_i1.p1  ORF type:complete len:498 (+),score=106.87 TRINITY_DN747_c0_g4_i1:117-1610(+)